MKFEVNVEKKFAFGIVAVALVIAGLFYVGATFNTPNPGHAGADICDDNLCVVPSKHMVSLGSNSPTADLGVEKPADSTDLFVFDRTGSAIMTLRGDGVKGGDPTNFAAVNLKGNTTSLWTMAYKTGERLRFDYYNQDALHWNEIISLSPDGRLHAPGGICLSNDDSSCITDWSNSGSDGGEGSTRYVRVQLNAPSGGNAYVANLPIPGDETENYIIQLIDFERESGADWQNIVRQVNYISSFDEEDYTDWTEIFRGQWSQSGQMAKVSARIIVTEEGTKKFQLRQDFGDGGKLYVHLIRTINT